MITGKDSSIQKSIEMRNNLQKNNNFNNQTNTETNNDFNMDSFNNGTQYYNMGGKLENVSQDLRRNKDFLNGYNRAARVSIIRNHKNGRNI